MTDVKKFNAQTFGEELSNAISHGVGAALAIAAATVLIVRACFTSSAIGIVSASVYGASLILLYLSSCMYHSLTNYTAKKVFQVVDHCMIFILILGTYTPICLQWIGGAMGWALFGVNAFCTVVGIVLNSIDLARWHKLSLVLYVLMGWSVLMSVKSILTIAWPGLVLLVGGGLLYTLGIGFYRASKGRYLHFVWHLFVLGGSILHFFCIYFYIYI